jgi:hypothetical protein
VENKIISNQINTEGGDLAVGLHELFLIEKSLEIAA